MLLTARGTVSRFRLGLRFCTENADDTGPGITLRVTKFDKYLLLQLSFKILKKWKRTKKIPLDLG